MKRFFTVSMILMWLLISFGCASNSLQPVDSNTNSPSITDSPSPSESPNVSGSSIEPSSVDYRLLPEPSSIWLQASVERDFSDSQIAELEKYIVILIASYNHTIESLDKNNMIKEEDALFMYYQLTDIVNNMQSWFKIASEEDEQDETLDYDTFRQNIISMMVSPYAEYLDVISNNITGSNESTFYL